MILSSFLLSSAYKSIKRLENHNRGDSGEKALPVAQNKGGDLTVSKEHRVTDRVVKIKKYGNRRLYSTTEKRYLTLPEVEQLVASGTQIEVKDATHNKDITSELLIQILLEKGKLAAFPRSLLAQWLSWPEHLCQNFFNSYPKEIFQELEDQGTRFHDQVLQDKIKSSLSVATQKDVETNLI